MGPIEHCSSKSYFTSDFGPWPPWFKIRDRNECGVKTQLQSLHITLTHINYAISFQGISLKSEILKMKWNRKYNYILSWFNAGRIRINSRKSPFMIFHHMISSNSPELGLGNNFIFLQDCIKYINPNTCIARNEFQKECSNERKMQHYKQAHITILESATKLQHISIYQLIFLLPFVKWNNKILQISEITSLRAITRMK